MSMRCFRFIPAYMPQVQLGVGTKCSLNSNHFLASSVVADATSDFQSSRYSHFASKATLGVHGAPFKEATPSEVQFHARYATKGSTYTSGVFAKSTPYLAWGNAPPRRLERRARLNGRLRHWDFGSHGWFHWLFLFPAQGSG